MTTMRLDLGQHLRMDQKMILAPRMIQSMEILQLPIMALTERIQQELQENPVLELKDTTEDVAGAEAETPAATEEKDPASDELVIDESGDNELDFDRLEALSKDWEDHFNEEHRPSRNGMDDEVDKKHDAMQNMASRPQSLQDYLNDQLSFLDIEPAQLKLMRYVIANIDDNGWLTSPAQGAEPPPAALLEELARNYEDPVPVEQVAQAL